MDPLPGLYASYRGNVVVREELLDEHLSAGKRPRIERVVDPSRRRRVRLGQTVRLPHATPVMQVLDRQGIPVDEGTCLVCGDLLEGHPLMSCPTCETPHHQDCWSFQGGCGRFACEPPAPTLPAVTPVAAGVPEAFTALVLCGPLALLHPALLVAAILIAVAMGRAEV